MRGVGGSCPASHVWRLPLGTAVRWIQQGRCSPSLCFIPNLIASGKECGVLTLDVCWISFIPGSHVSSLSRLVSSARSHTCSDHVLSFDWCMHQVHRHFRATKHFGFLLPHAALKALVSFVQFRLHQASRQSVALTCVRARVWSLIFPVGIAQRNNIGGPIPFLCSFMFATRYGVAFPGVKCVSLKVYAAPWNPAVHNAKLSFHIRLSIPGGAWQLLLGK